MGELLWRIDYAAMKEEHKAILSVYLGVLESFGVLVPVKVNEEE